ncbi:recombination protein NinG [Pseudomonas luteola]|uniref:recombination protein NinG n=1 Tax=Pseudomonas luteola TaxID=47886 RepID=UPI003DA1C37B
MSTAIQKAPRQAKARKCKNPECRAEFVPARSFQTWCSPDCAIAITAAKKQKERKTLEQRGRREIKVRKEKLKSRSDYMREAQISFNAFIRERDRLAGHCCISSGRTLDWNGNAVDAGHYRSVGAAPHLRFDERNCHAQSKQDNRYLSGNAVDYRIGLIQRIGLEAVEALEADQSVRKYTIEDLKAITAHYRAKTRELKRGEAV